MSDYFSQWKMEMVYKKPPLTQHESSNRTNVAHSLKKSALPNFI